MIIVESAGFYSGPMNSIEHSHTCCEIFYLKKGRIHLTIDGRDYYPKENSVHIISPLEKHALTCMSDEYERYIIFLNLHGFEALFTNQQLSTILKNHPPGFDHVFYTPGGEIESIFRSCFEEYVNNASCQYSNLRLVNLISELLILLYRNDPDKFSLRQDSARLARIQKYLEDNLDKPLKIKEIADLFYINPYYLSHIFKSYTGYSPKQYLMKIRFIKVCQLLCNTDLTIEEIAVQSGFETLNDLSRQFKKTFGLSPKDFRKKSDIILYH